VESKRIIKLFTMFFFIAFLGLAKFAEANISVQKAQFLLSEMGFKVGVIDGLYGKKTASALKSFYVSLSLKFDGKLDENELNDLQQAARLETPFIFRPHLEVCATANKRRKQKIAQILLEKYLLGATKFEEEAALKCVRSGLDGAYIVSSVHGIPKLKKSERTEQRTSNKYLYLKIQREKEKKKCGWFWNRCSYERR
jgi:hypothetical protein